MNGRNEFHPAFRLVLFLSLLAVLSSAASAQVLVDISPKGQAAGVLTLYLDESADYDITVLNTGTEPVEGILLKATASDGLKIIDSGIEKTVFSAKVEELGPGEKEIVLLTVKPVELSAERLFLYVDYGIASYTHLVATFVSVSESPLQVNSNLSKIALDAGEEASLKLSLKNNGPEPLTGIKAELLTFQGLESLDGAVELAYLAPGEAYEAREMVFRADPTAAGKIPLALLVSFDNSLGKHVIEKSFFVEIQSRETVLYLIAGIIVLLVFVALVSRKRESKPVKRLEKPMGKEKSEAKPEPPPK